MSPLAACLLCALIFQDPSALFEKAPPAVDEALRARISLFFQAHVDGKFRAAMDVVAEDSKDAFFSAHKPRCYSFEILKIDYSENFTRATATVACEMDHPSPGLGGAKVKAPRTTLWKLADGHWWYYIDPNAGYQTPFGVMRPGPGTLTTVPPAVTSGTAPPPPNVDIEAMLAWLKADKRELRFLSDKPGSDEVALTNGGPGTATLIMQYADMPGLEIKLDRKELNQNETARLQARWQPGKIPPPATIPVQIVVQPTGQLVTILTLFQQASAK